MFTLKIMFCFFQKLVENYLSSQICTTLLVNTVIMIYQDYLLKNWYICIYLYTFLYQAISMLCRHNNSIQLAAYSQVPLTVNGCLQAQVLHKLFRHGCCLAQCYFCLIIYFCWWGFSCWGKGGGWVGCGIYTVLC